MDRRRYMDEPTLQTDIVSRLSDIATNEDLKLAPFLGPLSPESPRNCRVARGSRCKRPDSLRVVPGFSPTLVVGASHLPTDRCLLSWRRRGIRKALGLQSVSGVNLRRQPSRRVNGGFRIPPTERQEHEAL